MEGVRERKVDVWLWIAVFGLMVVGELFIASATLSRPGAESLPWHRQGHIRQLVWYLAGLGLAAPLILVDYGKLCRWTGVAYWGSIGLLLVVFAAGSVRYGARRWIDLGPVQFQPSEFAKLACVAALAAFLSRPERELRERKAFFQALGLALLPCLLILLEPDLGSSIVFVPAALVMMYVAGVSRRRLLRFVGAGAALGVFLVVNVLWLPDSWRVVRLQPYQERRILVYFGKMRIPEGASAEEKQRLRRLYRDAAYNVNQALISVGSGGLWGKGWRRGAQHALGYLPRGVAHNDFIFSVVAEESGFVGSVTLLGLYTILFLRGARIAAEARDRLGKLLAIGLTTLLFVHVFINIGMNIRLLPVTGLPLPFLSYGGTSAVACVLAAALLQNVYLHRRDW